MENNDLKRLIKIEDRIKDIVFNEMGLKSVPVEFDIVPPQKMLEIMAYRLPTNVSNWKYGRDYERNKTIYEQFGDSLPYEVVIHDDPARAYLMDSNTLAVQSLVIAHVYGHSVFFTENKWFQKSRQDIMSIMREASKRFSEYEKIYGIEEVERVIDAGHALQMHSNPFDNETEEEKRLRVFEQLKQKKSVETVSDFGDLVKSLNTINDSTTYNNKLWQLIKNQIPVEPTEDLLRFIIDNSRYLDDWQKDILEILRIEGQYYWPIMKTRYMNEGFACITGNSLVHTENGFVPIEEAEEYCNYVVGLDKKLTNIEERYYTKKVPTVKIKTNTGLELEGAELHRIQILSDNDEIKDVFLKDLKIGDTPLMSVGVDIWPDNKIEINMDKCLKHLKFNKSKDVKIPINLNEDIAYFMGLFISEGCFIGRGIEITNTNLDLLKNAEEIIINNFDYEPSLIKRSELTNKYDLKIYSTAIIDFFDQLGMKNNKSGDKEIPWSILQSPKSVVSSFIAGYFDGDGCVYYNGRNNKNLIFTSKSEKLIKQLVILLLNYGIVGSFRLNKKNGYEDCYQLVISRAKCLDIFNNLIPIKDTKKIELLKNCLENVKWFFEVTQTCKIIDITFGENINYDWHIPNGNHYVAQGFINHNTFIHQKIMTKLFDEGFLNADEHGQYNYSNSLVKAMHRFSMNPYLIGSGMWEDIEDRWNKGKYGKDYIECGNYKLKTEWNTKEMGGFEKCKDIMRTYTDWFFMQDFLTEEVIDKLDMYIYVKVKNQNYIDYVRTEHTPKQIRELIVNSFSNSGIPKISITDGNHKNNSTLYMCHEYSGMELEKQNALKTLEHICYLWDNPVILKTIINDESYEIKIEKKTIE